MPFEVVALGIGDTFTAKHNPGSLLLRHDGEHLAIDCPDRYLGVLAEAERSTGWRGLAANTHRMLITHVHGDHMNGLEGYAFYKHFVECRKLQLLCVPEVRETLWEKRLAAPMSQLWTGTGYRHLVFDDYFDFTPLDWDRGVTCGPFLIRSRPTIHHVPTSALLITAGGRTLGYSADTAFDPALIDFLDAADLIIHETNCGPAHTRYEDLATLDVRIRTKMRLIHYSDQYETALSVIPMAIQGQVINI